MSEFLTREQVPLRDGRSVDIRAGRADDGDRFLRFFDGLSAQSRDFMHGWTQACSPEFAGQLAARATAADHRAIVAVAEGQIVGYCWIDGLHVNDMPMLGIGIIDAYHEAGLGRVLLRLMVEWAGELGAKQVRLGVFTDNARGIHVYRKVGFVDDPTMPAKVFDGRTELYMAVDTAAVPRSHFPLLEASGTPYAIGVAHGKAFASCIESAIAALPELLPVPMAAATAYALQSLPYCRRHAPELLEEVQGIADGAGLTFEQIFTLNASLDLQLSARQLTAPAPAPDCWAAAVREERGATVLWTAEDSARWLDACVLLRLRPDGGVPCLLWTFAGFVGRPGVNPSLSLAAAAQFADDCAPGLPYPFLCRKVLACATTEEAVQTINRYDRMAGMAYVVGDAAGDNAAVMTTARSVRVWQRGEATAFSSGRFELNRMVRFTKLLPAGDYTAMQRDHDQGALCAHDDSGLFTLTAFQCRVPNSMMRLSYGPPCTSGYIRYSL